MYYIDFDNTLYETGKMTKDILNSLAKYIANNKNLEVESIFLDLKESFNSTIDNFWTFSEKIAQKYDVPYTSLKDIFEHIIVDNGKNYVFPDALNFLKKLHGAGETICILTFVAQELNLNQQALKLFGSGILEYITEVYNTTRYKYTLELDYKNGIFIDDSPRDLEGLYHSGVRNLIRIKKPNNEKRTSKELNIPIEIPTYTSFDDIKI